MSSASTGNFEHVIAGWVCVLQLFTCQSLKLQILTLTLALLSNRFLTWIKNLDKDFNILRMKWAFKISHHFNGLSAAINYLRHKIGLLRLLLEKNLPQSDWIVISYKDSPNNNLAWYILMNFSNRLKSKLSNLNFEIWKKI